MNKNRGGNVIPNKNWHAAYTEALGVGKCVDMKVREGIEAPDLESVNDVGGFESYRARIENANLSVRPVNPPVGDKKQKLLNALQSRNHSIINLSI